MTLFNEYVGLIIKIINKKGDRISGKLIGVDEKYLKLQFKSGLTALFAKDDILYCALVKHQPKTEVV